MQKLDGSANGNIMQKLDSTGSIAMNVVYDPFGNVIAGLLVGEYGFSTKPLVDGLDWYYYGFRYYDPVTGRWPNRDPISDIASSGNLHFEMWENLNFPQLALSFSGYNSFAFSRNNPIVLIDPDGRYWQYVIPVVIGGGILILDRLTDEECSPENSFEDFEVEVGCERTCEGSTFAICPDQSGDATGTAKYKCEGSFGGGTSWEFDSWVSAPTSSDCDADLCNGGLLNMCSSCSETSFSHDDP